MKKSKKQTKKDINKFFSSLGKLDKILNDFNNFLEKTNRKLDKKKKS